MRRVRVLWEDHETIATWHVVGEAIAPARPVTEGILVVEHEDYIVVAATLCDGEYNAAQKILRRTIIGEIEEIV